MTDKQTIEPCMGCSALDCWGVVDCDVAQRVLALHKTLTEIKEIAQNVIKNVSDRCIETTPMYYIHKQILQKISECEEQDGN